LSTTVELAFSYAISDLDWSTGGYDEVGIDLISLGGDEIYGIQADSISTQTGSFYVQVDVSASDYQAFQWRPYVSGVATSSPTRYGAFELFFVPGGSYTDTPSPLLIGSNNATGTDAVANIPNFILQYPPFSWIVHGFTFAGLFSAASNDNATSTISLPYYNSLTVDTENPAGHVNVDFDIGTAFPAVGMILDVMIAAMWATIGLALILAISRLV
jgi:hypothetical protein